MGMGMQRMDSELKKEFNKKSVYGKLFMIEGCILLIPCILLIFYPDERREAFCFLIPGALSIVFGFLLMKFSLAFKTKKEAPSRQLRYHSSEIVLTAWVYGFLLGAIPFLLLGNYNPVQAIFEAVSGFTTTGLSVMRVDEASHLFLFYRSFIQFVGGLGFILMMMIFLQEKQEADLYNAEGHPDRIKPSPGKTARAIFGMYSGFLLAGTASYMLFGMDLFESVNHAMCALSTGGFSTRVDSIAEYNSLGVEAVTIALMLIGTTNFAVLLLLVKGKVKQAGKVSEVKFMGLLLALSIPLTAVILYHGLYGISSESIRQAIFNVVSALSTTGFATCSYADWPSAALFVMILLMLIGGGIGSTAGGIKMSRVYLGLRGLKSYVGSRLGARHEIKAPYYYKAQGKTEIDQNLLEDTFFFIGAYLIIYVLGTMGICISESCTLQEAMFEFASALGTVGLSIGITGPETGNMTLIIEIIGMFMGRLEIFAVITGIYAVFVRIKGRIKGKKSRFQSGY